MKSPRLDAPLDQEDDHSAKHPSRVDPEGGLLLRAGPFGRHHPPPSAAQIGGAILHSCPLRAKRRDRCQSPLSINPHAHTCLHTRVFFKHVFTRAEPVRTGPKQAQLEPEISFEAQEIGPQKGSGPGPCLMRALMDFPDEELWARVQLYLMHK